jgi:hypothetical protein
MSDWNVLPHGKLTELAPNLWYVSGSLPNIPLPRNMVVHRLPDGRLLLHSVICLDEEEMKEIEALGTPAIMVVPNEGHRLDCKAWKARYPALQVICPANARAKVEEVLKADATCEEVLPALGISFHVPPGFKPGYELIYEIDQGDGKALIVNDVLANGSKIGGFQGMMLGLLGTPGGGFGRPRIVSFFFGQDRGAFKPFLEQLRSRDDVATLTMSHGTPVTGRDEVKARLGEAIAKL